MQFELDHLCWVWIRFNSCPCSYKISHPQDLWAHWIIDLKCESKRDLYRLESGNAPPIVIADCTTHEPVGLASDLANLSFAFWRIETEIHIWEWRTESLFSFCFFIFFFSSCWHWDLRAMVFLSSFTWNDDVLLVNF